MGVPDRHRTLRAAIAWSHELLNDEEQALFARLAVFRGGRSVEAISEICGFDGISEPMAVLESLIDKSAGSSAGSRQGAALYDAGDNP